LAVLAVTAGNEASLRTQTAACAAGDVLAIPGGVYNMTAQWTVSKGIFIQYDSTVGGNSGGVRVNALSGQHGINIDNSAASISRLNLSRIKFTSGGGTSNGINFVAPGGSSFALSHFRAESCDCVNFSNGVFVDNSGSGTGGSAGLGTQFVFYDLDVSGSTSRGIVLKNLSVCEIENCEVNSSGLNGIWANACGNLGIRKSASEGNNTTNDTSEEGASQVLVKLSHGFAIDNLDIESLPTNAAAAKVGVCVSRCFGGSITALAVTQTGTTFYANSKGVYLFGGTRGMSKIDVITKQITTPIAKDVQSVLPPPEAMFTFQVSPYSEAFAGLQTSG